MDAVDVRAERTAELHGYDVRAERTAELHGYVAEFLGGLRDRTAAIAEFGDHRDVADAMAAVEA